MKRPILLLVFTAIAAQAWELFVPDRQYRFCKPGDQGCPTADVIAKIPDPKDHQAAPGRKHQPEIVSQDGYSMAFIEYNDSGKRWDNLQLESAKLLIETQRRRDGDYGGPIHLIMFVHGWANNADAAPAGTARDVERFQNYLKYYAASLDANKWPVVGIYFAWHGRSLNLNHGLHTPSFWTRSAAARRVGAGDLYHDFQCLSNLGTYNLAAGRRPNRGCEAYSSFPAHAIDPTAKLKRSRVIAMGHSFGARVLETALVGGEPSHGQFAGSCKTMLNGESGRPPIDLVIFENAATSAHLIRQQFTSCQPCGRGSTGCEDFGKKPPRDFSNSVMMRSWEFDKAICRQPENRTLPQCQPHPLLVSISGKGDVLTRFVLPFASGAIPAAFLPWLQTHTVEEAKTEADADPDKEEVLKFDICVKFDSGNNCLATKSYVLKRKRLERVAPVNAIWTMAVPRDVIKDHGDVWNHGYLNLALNLLATRDPAAGPAPPPPAQDGQPKLAAAEEDAGPTGPKETYKGQRPRSGRIRIQPTPR